MSIVLGFIMFSYMNRLTLQEKQNNCNPTKECQQVKSLFGLSHIAVGFLAFIFALGFYLLFFNKDAKTSNALHDDILKELHEQKIQKKAEDKFNLLLRALDENEKKVLTSIKEQQGITQSTLKYRANLSKAKISQILGDFEKKNIVARKAKGKTYEVFLTEDF
ncbi:MarR family transcriptional regulator [Candidatus Woesearchaeota archaeon]|nr:MarR family transcriptional regulator [Candidatus Woesearchaeota archaeon]